MVIALHGYGQTPTMMLSPMRRLLGPGIPIAAVQGPFPFFATPNGVPRAGANVIYNWGVAPHWEDAIRLHHEIVNEVVAQLADRYRIEPRSILLAGFSQPVGLNYRFAAAHPDRIGGVAGFCGGVPNRWDPPHRITAPLLHISRDEDEFFPVDVVRGFPDRLRQFADDVEFHLLPGPHRFPSQSAPLVRAWIERVFKP